MLVTENEAYNIVYCIQNMIKETKDCFTDFVDDVEELEALQSKVDTLSELEMKFTKQFNLQNMRL